MESSVFNQKAEDYALYRPQYHSNAIKVLIDITGMKSDWCVADIGSGTGNVSRHFVEKVQNVFAVEPERAMRYQAELLLVQYSSFKSIDAAAEATTLDDHSIDLITIGQASHWIDWDKALKEFKRIIKPEGWIAIIWNQYETTPDINVDFIFNPCTKKDYSFPSVINETWAEYIGGIRSASRNPSPADEEYEAFEQKHRKRFGLQAVDGLISVRYTTELTVGRLKD